MGDIEQRVHRQESKLFFKFWPGALTRRRILWGTSRLIVLFVFTIALASLAPWAFVSHLVWENEHSIHQLGEALPWGFFIPIACAALLASWEIKPGAVLQLGICIAIIFLTDYNPWWWLTELGFPVNWSGASWAALSAVILLTLLIARRSWRFRIKPGPLIAAALLCMPLFSYAWQQIQLQGTTGTDSSHGIHWTSMAIGALLVCILAIIGGLGVTGWRVPLWSAAAGATVLAIASLRWPHLPSALDSFRAIAICGLALLLVVVGEIYQRKYGDGSTRLEIP